MTLQTQIQETLKKRTLKKRTLKKRTLKKRTLKKMNGGMEMHVMKSVTEIVGGIMMMETIRKMETMEDDSEDDYNNDQIDEGCYDVNGVCID